MSRSTTGAWSAIRSMCRIQQMKEETLYVKAKMILSVYRNVCWNTIGRVEMVAEELICYCGSDLDSALIYLETFAPEREKEHFESRIRSLFETRWMIELIENTMVRVRDFPEGGNLYFDILSKCYLTSWKYTENEMLELLNMERSRFYDRKKEAIIVFGLALWGSAIPQLKNFLSDTQEEYATLPRKM